MGALWLMKGERVAELTETTARFDRGLAFDRRLASPGRSHQPPTQQGKPLFKL